MRALEIYLLLSQHPCIGIVLPESIGRAGDLPLSLDSSVTCLATTAGSPIRKPHFDRVALTVPRHNFDHSEMDGDRVDVPGP